MQSTGSTNSSRSSTGSTGSMHTRQQYTLPPLHHSSATGVQGGANRGSQYVYQVPQSAVSLPSMRGSLPSGMPSNASKSSVKNNKSYRSTVGSGHSHDKKEEKKKEEKKMTTTSTTTTTSHSAQPKVITTIWEDENTVCYQVEANGVSVVRRADNDMVNGTKLLNVTRMTRGRRDGILKSERIRHVVKIGSMNLKGVWVPFERAYTIAKREKIVDLLFPLFVKDIHSVIFSPKKHTGAAAAKTPSPSPGPAAGTPVHTNSPYVRDQLVRDQLVRDQNGNTYILQQPVQQPVQQMAQQPMQQVSYQTYPAYQTYPQMLGTVMNLVAPAAAQSGPSGGTQRNQGMLVPVQQFSVLPPGTQYYGTIPMQQQIPVQQQQQQMYPAVPPPPYQVFQGQGQGTPVGMPAYIPQSIPQSISQSIPQSIPQSYPREMNFPQQL